MKCVIPGVNLKVFGRAVHSLSKIGDELYVEALPDGLSLRTVNSSRSAYACFLFLPTFFQKYSDINLLKTNDDDPDLLKCKINMKSCLTVFKSLPALEKTVDKCKISINMDEARLVFQLHCKHGIVKTHNITFIECEALQAVFSKDFSPNLLRSQSRFYSDIVMNFQPNQEEISLLISPERVVLKNYIDESTDANKVVRTELTLSPEEFDSYRCGVDTEVTFCLKELRALLTFSEPSNLPLSLYIETTGRPLILCIDSDPTFEVNFVLATLADPATVPIGSQQPSVSSVDRHKNTSTVRSKLTSTSTVRKKRNTHGETKLTMSRSRQDGSSNASHFAAGDSSKKTDKTTNDNNDNHVQPNVPAELEESSVALENEEVNISNDVSISDVYRRLPALQNPKLPSNGIPTGNDHQSTSTSKEEMASTSRNEPPSGRNKMSLAKFLGNDDDDDDDSSPVIPFIQTSNLIRGSDLAQTSLMEVDEEKEEEDDLVPGTPPNKRFKSLFFGISQSSTGAGSQTQSTFHPPVVPVVLAEDSEED